MNRYLSFLKCIILISCLILLATGCSTKKARRLEDMGHAELLEKGLKQSERGELAGALMSLQLVKDRYPYTESAVVASLKLADTYYNMGEYAIAYDLYSEFERFHPNDSDIPYIKFQRGMCFFKQIKGFDREQKHAMAASVEFLRLINLYPDNEYSIKARRHYRECLLNLTRFEIYTGNFYFRQGHYLSALRRYKYAIEKYPDLGQYYEALQKISICNLKLAELDTDTVIE
ncbi:MAG: outer membrane protein assembly factor BamD [Deltaproteobacteria bacterium]|nr:outer membrane protein assembly factor BamD [Deltaproteobacteria bacterium]